MVLLRWTRLPAGRTSEDKCWRNRLFEFILPQNTYQLKLAGDFYIKSPAGREARL
jgi:hypothetical protein